MHDGSESLVRRLVLQQLESLRRAGVQQLARRSKATESTAAQLSSTGVSSPRLDSTKSAPVNADDVDAGRLAPSTRSPRLFDGVDAVDEPVVDASSLESLDELVKKCTLCHELATTRTQTVFGVGNPNAELCFLGEAPGADEDRQGEPFVGRAGQLLDKILAACQLSRDEVYIMNILKCRPPNNRNPLPQEADNCRGFLNRQLQLIAPKFICCLGAVAAQNLLDTTESIGRLRGKIHDYLGIRVICTYHPAYLLRTPSAKRYTWDDMKLLMRELGRPVD